MSSNCVFYNPDEYIEKDPNARRRYGLDLSRWLYPGDKVIDVEVTTTGVIVDGLPAVLDDEQRVAAWLSGGAVGEPASATFRFFTEQGAIDDRTLRFDIRER